MYLSEILSKLQMFTVNNFMTFSDGLLLICNFAYKLYTFNLKNLLKCSCACFMYVDEILMKLQFYEISN